MARETKSAESTYLVERVMTFTSTRKEHDHASSTPEAAYDAHPTSRCGTAAPAEWRTGANVRSRSRKKHRGGGLRFFGLLPRYDATSKRHGKPGRCFQ